METLVTELTETGLDSLDSDKLRELKRICQRDDGGTQVACAFQALLKALSKEHAQIRISSLQAINELFGRSHQFRLLVIAELPHISSLVFGAYQRPLARPSNYAAKLKQLAAEYIYAWTEKYGAAYQRLVLGFRYLRHVERVDFRTAAKAFKRNDPAQIERLRAAKKENRDEYMLRVLEAVRADFQCVRPAIEDALRMLNECFAILIPDIADLFADTGLSRAEDSDADVEEIMAVMAVNRHAVDVDVNPDRIIETEESGDNAAVYDVIRDYLRLCTMRYEPRLAAWAERLGRLDSSIDPGLGKALEAVSKLRGQVADVVSKCADLGVSNSYLCAGSNSSGDEFEEVASDFHKTRTSSKRQQQALSEPVAACRRKRHAVFSLLGEAGLEADPTYVRPEILRQRQKVDTSTAVCSNPTEDELRQTAPVVEYGPDLMYWSQDFVDANTSGLEIRHRFLGSAQEEATLSGEAMESLRKRAVYYSDAIAGVNGGQCERRREIRACRAPLKGGRLCPRRDLVKCPFHGVIVDRDEEGRAQGGFILVSSDATAATDDGGDSSSTPRQSTVATAETIGELEWRDVEALVNQKRPPLAAPKRVKKQEAVRAKSALVDKRKSKAPSMGRLQAMMLRKRQK